MFETTLRMLLETWEKYNVHSYILRGQISMLKIASPPHHLHEYKYPHLSNLLQEYGGCWLSLAQRPRVNDMPHHSEWVLERYVDQPVQMVDS